LTVLADLQVGQRNMAHLNIFYIITHHDFQCTTEGQLGVKVTALIAVDPDIVAKEIQRFKQNQDIQILYKELLARNKQLEQELKRLSQAPEKKGVGQALVQEALALEYVMKGVKFYQNGQEKQALAEFSLALNKHPRLAVAYNNRGFIWMQKGLFVDAENDFNQAISCDPNYSAAWFNRGGLFWRQHESEKAIKDLSRALELEPKMVRAWYNRAYIYLQTGQFEKSLFDLSQLVRLSPKDASNWALRAELFKRQKNYPQAEKDLYQALKLQPNSENYLLELYSAPQCQDRKSCNFNSLV